MKPHLQHSDTRMRSLFSALIAVVIFTASNASFATDSAEEDTPYTPRGSVARTAFTSAIEDREPVDNLSHVPNTVSRVYFFSDLRNLAGEIVTHRWEYEGKVMAEVKFRVGGGPRWRVYSSKNLIPEWTGKWTVVVLDESGWPLKASMFEYVAAETPATSPTP